MTGVDLGSLWKIIWEPGAAWLLTYLIHSTLLLGAVWALAQSARISRPVRDVLWKTALVGGILTATVQVVGGGGGLAGAWTVGAPSRTAVHAPAGAPEASPARAAIPPSILDTVWEGARTGAARGWPQLLVGAWVLGAALCVARLFGTRRRLDRNLTPRREITTGPIRESLNHLCRSAGMVPAIRLSASRRIGSPVVLGNREICLPERALTDLDREQQYTVLAHELAHVLRRDPAWRWISAAVQGIFFLQPLNRVARRNLLDNAEFLADDWAVTRTGDGVTLARCLLEVAVWVKPFPAALEAAGMAERGTPLVRRVERLLATGTRRQVTGRRTLAAAGALLVLIAAVSPGFMPYPHTRMVAGPAPLEAVVTPIPPVPFDPAHALAPARPERPRLGEPGTAPTARVTVPEPDRGAAPRAVPRVPDLEIVPRADIAAWAHAATQRLERAQAFRQVIVLQVRPAVLNRQMLDLNRRGLDVQALEQNLQVLRQNLEGMRIEAEGIRNDAESRRAFRKAQDLLHEILEEPVPPVPVFWI